MEKLRVGFLPTYRFHYTDWCRQVRASGLSVLRSFEQIEVIAPPAPDEGDPLPGIPQGALNTIAQAETLSDYFIAHKVQAVVVCPLDFGDERTVSKLAERVRVPLMLYATKEPPAHDDITLSRVSDSYCGTLSIAAGLKRRQIPFYFGGIFFHEEDAFRSALEIFLRAASVVRALQGAQIGQIGQRPPYFETVAYDEVAMAAKFGMNVIHQDLATILSTAQSLDADDPALQTNVQALRASMDEIAISNEQVLTLARLETAIKAFSAQNNLRALGINCWPQFTAQTGVSACALFGRLTESGLPTGCETDVMGALAMLAQYAGVFGKFPPHFIDWTIQHREHDDRFLAWHCGNAPASLASPASTRALRSRNDMLGAIPPNPADNQAGLAQFQLMPGVVTMNRLVEYNGQWKMLVTRGEIVPSDDVLAGTWAWVRVKDHQRLYRVLAEEGFMHHASLIHADLAEVMRLACQFMDIEVVEV